MWRPTLISNVAVGAIVLLSFVIAGWHSPLRIVWAQESAQLSFEVAAVKHAPNAEHRGVGVRIAGSLIHGTNMTLVASIAYAYDRANYEISGGPAWARTDRFDFEAKAPGPNPPSRGEVKNMMRTLLKERFGLSTHDTTKSIQGYALVVSARGLKMQISAPDASSRYRVSGNAIELIEVTKGSMKQLARSLTSEAGRPVVDQTGLTGDYDYRLEFSDGKTDDGPSIFYAVQEQLGLKLKPTKAPIQILNIDRAERPTQN